MEKVRIVFAVVMCLLFVGCSNEIEPYIQDGVNSDAIISESLTQGGDNIEYIELSKNDYLANSTDDISDGNQEKTNEENDSDNIVQSDEIIIQESKIGDDILYKTDDVSIEDDIIEKELDKTSLIEENQSDIKSKNTEYRLITADELLEYANLSRKDISYIDVDAFVNEYKFTTQVFELVSAEEIRNQFIKDNEKEKKYQEWAENYVGYLVQALSIEKPENFEMTKCKKIALYYYHENEGKSIVLDLEKDKIYYGSGEKNPINNKNNAEITVDLTYDILADVIIRIEDAKLEELDYSYISQEDIMARNSWGIAFECEEGIVRYYVYNATGEEPSRIINCVHDLLEYAKGLAE